MFFIINYTFIENYFRKKWKRNWQKLGNENSSFTQFPFFCHKIMQISSWCCLKYSKEIIDFPIDKLNCKVDIWLALAHPHIIWIMIKPHNQKKKHYEIKR